MHPDRLLEAIRRAARALAPADFEPLVSALRGAGSRPLSQGARTELLRRLMNPQARVTISELLEQVGAETGVGAGELEAARHCEQAARRETSIELVWTGPATPEVPLRRTDQVLLQLIRETRQRLLIVSFAVYDVPEIVEALAASLDRGVALRIVAEDPEAGPGKVAYGARATFGSQILTRAPIYVWPREQRPRDGKGRHGSLHVKCAVADGSQLLISSANLTGYAMELNMEMGLLVRQQELSRRIEEHFAALVERGVLVLCPAP